MTWTDGHTGSEPKRPVETKKNVFTFVLQSVSGMANCTAAGTSLLTYTGLTYTFNNTKKKQTLQLEIPQEVCRRKDGHLWANMAGGGRRPEIPGDVFSLL